MEYTEDDTFIRLKRTTYKVVWEQCKEHTYIKDDNERKQRIKECKFACG